MIFARKSIEGKAPTEFVLVGLSSENIEQLKAGKPISIGPVPEDEPLATMQIVLMYGDSENDIITAMKKVGLIDANTQLNE